MRNYYGFIDFREVPGKASKGPQASPGVSWGSPGGRQSVPGDFPGRPQGIPGGPWEVLRAGGSQKESSSAMGVRFVRSLEGSWGISGGSLRGPQEVPWLPPGSLGNPLEVPGPKEGSFSVTEV